MHVENSCLLQYVPRCMNTWQIERIAQDTAACLGFIIYIDGMSCYAYNYPTTGVVQ